MAVSVTDRCLFCCRAARLFAVGTGLERVPVGVTPEGNGVVALMMGVVLAAVGEVGVADSAGGVVEEEGP